jgi:two-component system nitrogen regulation sensor histidine kinase GlnL
MSVTPALIEASSAANAALDQLTTAVAVFDRHGRFLHANPAFVELTGVVRWRGCTLEALGETTAQDLRGWFERVRTSKAALTRRGYDWTTRDPPLRVDLTVAPATGGGVVLELHPQTPSEAEASPRLSQTLRGLAHEVKNPLAGLRGAAQLLRRRLADADLQHLADLVIAEADRLGGLADRLLRPGGEPHWRTVNLHEVAERARALLAAEVAPEVKLARDYDPSLPPLRGDADRLLQLLLNLLRNAAQASATTIQVRTRAERGLVLGGQAVRLAARLDVIDDGVGVPEALRDTLFLPLVSGRAGGSGLGLALAQEIAHEHGGQIGFSSRPGRTVFSVVLPLENGRG